MIKPHNHIDAEAEHIKGKQVTEVTQKHKPSSHTMMQCTNTSTETQHPATCTEAQNTLAHRHKPSKYWASLGPNPASSLVVGLNP